MRRSFLLIIITLPLMTFELLAKFDGFKPPSQINIVNSVDLSKSSIDKAMQALGVTSVKDFDAIGGKSICYSNAKQVLSILFSDKFYGFEVSSQLFNKNIVTDCLDVEYDFINDLGIQLAMQKSEVVSILGKPDKELEKLLSYEYTSVDKLQNQQGIESSLYFNFRDNKLISYKILTMKNI